MKRQILRLLTEREEAELHLKDLKNGANTFEGCIRDIRKHTPEWLNAKGVEEEFRKLVRKSDGSANIQQIQERDGEPASNLPPE